MDLLWSALNWRAKWEAKIDELMDAVDKYVPQPERADLPFLMPIEDIFSISGTRHGCDSGKNQRANVKDEVWARMSGCRLPRRPWRSVCTKAWKCSRSSWTKAWRGDNAGASCCAVSRRKMWSASAGSGEARIDTPHTKFKGHRLWLKQGRGDRRYAVLQRISAAVLLRTTDVTEVAELPEEHTGR